MVKRGMPASSKCGWLWRENLVANAFTRWVPCTHSCMCSLYILLGTFCGGMEKCLVQLGQNKRQNGKEGYEQGRIFFEKRNVVICETSA